MAQTAWTEQMLIKKGSPYIKCENFEQRKQVIDVIESWGYKLYGYVKIHELYVCAMHDEHQYLTDISGYDNYITAAEFLNYTPPNPELTALKKRLMEIADSDRNELEKNYQYEGYIHNFIAYNIVSNTNATDLANLIINSDL